MIDNYDLWCMHEREQERKAAKRPKCSCCGEPIFDEKAYLIDEKLICKECLEDMEVWLEDEYL